jgi:hypothetical protein
MIPLAPPFAVKTKARRSQEESRDYTAPVKSEPSYTTAQHKLQSTTSGEKYYAKGITTKLQEKVLRVILEAVYKTV